MPYVQVSCTRPHGGIFLIDYIAILLSTSWCTRYRYLYYRYRSIYYPHRRIQDFVTGGKALLAPRGGGAKALLAPLDPRLTIWGSNFLWGGGGARPPWPPPPDPRLTQ